VNEKQNQPFRLSFNASLKVNFQGSRVTSDHGPDALSTQREEMRKAIACIVLPTFNEAENVSILLPRIFSQSGAIQAHELHVLVVDDHSPDGTANRVREAAHRYPNLHLLSGERRGLGDAYMRGIAHAIETWRPHLILQMDADPQHDPALLPQMITLASDSYDVVIGSRFTSEDLSPAFPYTGS
jgi:dolichol-phosphate mannosyltransferase